MAAAAGMLNHYVNGSQPQATNRVSPMTSTNSDSGGSGSSSKSSATIGANDFLTLLVTEMKNQDPTANTNPNEYINQLVNVNSLQQLISINETLTGAFGTSDATAYTKSSRTETAVVNDASSLATTTRQPVAQAANRVSTTEATSVGNSTAAGLNMHTFLTNLAHGNLSIPESSPAANRLSHALDGHADALVRVK
jgi:flagellar basal-body rod modification protein FlgD